MNDIKWQDPPPRQRGAGASREHQEIAAQLRDHPGQWALIIKRTPTSNFAANIKGGTSAAYRPAGSFDAVIRGAGKDDQGRRLYDVYARYVGEGGAS